MKELPTVVVVEDNDDLRALFCTYLELNGYTVQSFGSAEEALAALPTIARRLVILVDMRMPGMDGVGFVNALRANPALAGDRLILMSGDKDTRGLALPLLLKPVHEETLLHAVRQHCAAEAMS